MQLKRLIIVIVIGTLIVGAAAMATVYKLIPAGVLGLLAVANAAVILAVMRRGAFSARVRASPQLRAVTLVWPLAVLVGVAFEISDARRRGWKVDDTVGVVIALLVLACWYYVVVYRKQRGNSSGS